MVDIPPRLKTVGHVPRKISRDIFYFLKEKNGKVDGFVYSTQSQSSPVPAGGLEIPLKVTFKIATFITHQKMKDFMTNFYSYDCEVKAEADEDDDTEIHFMIANEHLDGDKENGREVVKRKVKRKPPKIGESSESDCEGILTLKKLRKSGFFSCFSPSFEKSDRKKFELEISTLEKIFVRLNFSSDKSYEIFHG